LIGPGNHVVNEFVQIRAITLDLSGTGRAGQVRSTFQLKKKVVERAMRISPSGTENASDRHCLGVDVDPGVVHLPSSIGPRCTLIYRLDSRGPKCPVEVDAHEIVKELAGLSFPGSLHVIV